MKNTVNIPREDGSFRAAQVSYLTHFLMNFYIRKKKEAYRNIVKSLTDWFNEWRLFIDSSTLSLKAMLLHNTNVYLPVPIAHSVVLSKEYNMK